MCSWPRRPSSSAAAARNLGQPPIRRLVPSAPGTPGSLPVMNERAFQLALVTAVALNCEIPEFTKWDRKQYYYPDLPKGYQISQFDLPMSRNGWLEISDPQDRFPTKRVGIIRAHLEEDAGKSMHDEVAGRGGQPDRSQPHRHAAVGNRQRAGYAVAAGGEGLSDGAEAAAELSGRLRLQHAGRQLARRCQRQSSHPDRRKDRSPRRSSKSRT